MPSPHRLYEPNRPQIQIRITRDLLRRLNRQAKVRILARNFLIEVAIRELVERLEAESASN